MVTCWTSLTGTRALTNARNYVWGTTWPVPDSGSLPARRADERESEDEGEDDGHRAARFPTGGEEVRPPSECHYLLELVHVFDQLVLELGFALGHLIGVGADVERRHSQRKAARR